MWSVPRPPTVAVTSSCLSRSDSWIQSSVDSFLKDGRKIRVGDCALFQAGNAPPFIGIIRWFTTSKEDCLKLCVNWLYRPSDVKLAKGILLEAAPNELFYSFHKDVISAASLLHPCKVAFLRKGVELPPGISSFVCRRVYDIANKCLWWLTDQDYINERQEEVDQLLDKTRLEMHAALQSGGRSPKPLNGPTSTQQLKSVTDGVQNSATSFPSQPKGKKRERGVDHGTDPIKRERPAKLEDGEFVSSRLDNMIKVERLDNMIKVEIPKIAEKGALLTIEDVEKLVHLVRLDKNERKIVLANKILLADVIAATDRTECLSRFVQLGGVPVLDDWLQEAHKGKTGDGSSPKESDKGTEDLLLSLLRALDKLPVNLNALQTCYVGKSVNHLRSHKNIEIQKKARSLVDTWKKRVDAEMTMINDAKSGGSNQAVTWPVKPGFSEVPHAGSRRSGSTEAITKTPISQTSSACKPIVGKAGHADAIMKSTPVTPGSLKLPSCLPASMSTTLKDSPSVGGANSGNLELPVMAVKEEKSSSSSQSQNNSQSCSGDYAKTIGSSWKEDGRNSTAGSVNANKTAGGSTRHRRSSNGFSGCSTSSVQEANLGKSGKVSNHSGLSSERALDMPSTDHGSSHRLIVRLPNPGRSPARCANGGTLEDPSNPGTRASSPVASDKCDHIDRKIKLKGDPCRSHVSQDVNVESLQCSDTKGGLGGSDERAAVLDEESRSADEKGRMTDACKAVCCSSCNGKGVSVIESKSRDSYSSMNALIESCAKYSEASTSISAGDDIGINLLANVAAGEISNLDSVSPSGSPGSSPKEDPCATSNEAKSRLSCEDGVPQSHGQCDENADFDLANLGKSIGQVLANDKIEEVSMHSSVDSKIIISIQEKKLTSKREGLEADGANQSEVEDNKPVDYTCEMIKEDDTKASDFARSSGDDGNSDKLVAAETSLHASSVNEVSGGATIADQQQPYAAGNHVEAADKTDNDDISSSTADKISASEIANECETHKPHEVKDNSLASSEGARKEQSGLAPSSVEQVDKILDGKEAFGDRPVVDGHEPPSAVPTQESEKLEKSVASKLMGASPDAKDEITSSVETSAKLDFDLNEGFSGDDANQSEFISSAAPVCSSASRLPILTSSMSNGARCPITVAAPAKGPFVPPENLLKGKGEPGWKGSAATSAFRPAEPRKVLEMPLNTSDVEKQGRPPLDIDLNVADERVIEDMTSQISPQTTGSESGVITRSVAGLDLDLNKADEGTENGLFLASASNRLEAPLVSLKRLPNGEANISRDFDLNNGPGPDEIGPESLHKSQHTKSNGNMPFIPSIAALRMGNAELGNVSSWFAPGNSYPAVAIPSFLPDRGEQNFPIVGAPGQRILGSVTGPGTFGSDLYRGPVLSSSPAMTFPPTTAFPYASFPFGASFPLTSTSFSGGSAPYVDSSCFPAIQSQLVGPAGAISAHYPRPYMMSLPEGSNSTGSERSRKWVGQGLDLNSGPGSADVDAKDDRRPSASRQLPIGSSQAFVEEQARMYQISGGGMKRKDREGGSWDERFYKQPSWQ